MYAGGVKKKSSVASGQLCRCARGAEWVVGSAAGSNADDGTRARIAGALDYLVAVAVERRIGEVRVAVDEVWNAVVLRGHLRSIQRRTGLAT